MNWALPVNSSTRPIFRDRALNKKACRISCNPLPVLALGGGRVGGDGAEGGEGRPGVFQSGVSSDGSPISYLRIRRSYRSACSRKIFACSDCPLPAFSRRFTSSRECLTSLLYSGINDR